MKREDCNVDPFYGHEVRKLAERLKSTCPKCHAEVIEDDLGRGCVAYFVVRQRHSKRIK
jgi:hypothetical protein